MGGAFVLLVVFCSLIVWLTAISLVASGTSWLLFVGLLAVLLALAGAVRRHRIRRYRISRSKS